MKNLFRNMEIAREKKKFIINTFQERRRKKLFRKYLSRSNGDRRKLLLGISSIRYSRERALLLFFGK